MGIRYKGSVGAFIGCVEGTGFMPTGRKTCLKLSMKVKFDEYVAGQRFFGVKRLQLHAMRFDPAMVAERLSYSLFREMGVAAPRAAHVRLLINGEYQGIFLLVEQIDGQFTRSRFSEGGKGNLYKEAWPITPNPSYYLDRLRTNRDEDPSAEKMIAFYEDIQADPNTAIEARLDIGYTMRYVAVDRAIRNDDGVMHFYCLENCMNHNFFWYEEVDTDRVWLIPWDMDPIFFAGFNPLEFPGDWRDVDPSCEPVPSPILPFPSRNPACDPLISALADYPDLYLASQRELLEGPFLQERVYEKLAAWQELIEDAVIEAHATDPGHIAPSAWQNQIQLRKATLDIARENLAAAVPEPSPTMLSLAALLILVRLRRRAPSRPA